MFIIMSGDYVCSELRSEFGVLPPSFLPVGNKRLYEHQVSILDDIDNDGILVLPEGYEISPHDKERLRLRGLRTQTVNDKYALGQSIFSVLSNLEIENHTTIRLIWGDTLFYKVTDDIDIIAVSRAADNYDWGYVEPYRLYGSDAINALLNEDSILTGFFCFSCGLSFLRALSSTNCDFFEALKEYQSVKELKYYFDDNWLDFGHAKTYYRSKALYTTQRSFNDLNFTSRLATKTSTDKFKMASEADWYLSIPDDLKIYTPRFIRFEDKGVKASYSIEHLYLISLSELYVFSELPKSIWMKIFHSCFEFVDACSNYTIEQEDIVISTFSALFLDKTLIRLEEYRSQSGVSQNFKWSFDGFSASLNDVFNYATSFLPPIDNSMTVFHGDFCFSNVLYDFRTDIIKVIDPRGYVERGVSSCFGLRFYDIVKLAHSVVGNYDSIICGYYKLELDAHVISFEIQEGRSRQDIKESFLSLVEKRYGYSKKSLYAGQIMLFMSMLPLHNDKPDRQFALLANVFRLFREMESF